MTADPVISETRTIPAPAAAIFDLLADPSRHGLIDGSGSVRGPLDDAPARLTPGAKFGMSMKLGAPYRIQNTVVEFEEGRRIAWRHFGRHVWRYLLEPIDEQSTRVTEQFDETRAPLRPVYGLIGARDRNRRSITETLQRLESWAVNR